MVATAHVSEAPTLLLRELVLSAGAEPLTVPVAPGHLVVAPAPPGSGHRLARTVIGLVAPHSGQILVDGRDVTDFPPGRRRIGYVPTGGGLLPHLTVRENIVYGQRSRPQAQAIAQEWTERLVDALELNALLLRRPHQLSLTHQLRVAIARAAASRPAALVVDRPDLTDGVDLLDDLVARVTPPGSPGLATLVCPDQPGPFGPGTVPGAAAGYPPLAEGTS